MTGTLAAFAVLAWLAYIASRMLARRQLPEVVAFLLVGALLGPSGIELISQDELVKLQPITEVALAILMFVIGERVSTRALKAARWALTAGIVQFAVSAVLVFFVTRSAGAGESVALVLAVLAGAGAPMTVAHVVSSVKGTGAYGTGLVGTHAISDALATTTFAAVLPVAALLSEQDAAISSALLDFLQLGIGGALLGVAGGWLISRIGFQIETSGELLLFVLVHILLAWSLSEWLGSSLPLAALVAGATAASVSAEAFSARLFRTIKSIEQPLYLLFFGLAGASIHMDDVVNVGLVGVAYVLVRVVGKIVGGLLGGMLGGLHWKTALRLGVNLTPQAGVAVGLAVLASETLGSEGSEIATVVLGSVVLFELIGPLLVARDLKSMATGEAQAAPLDHANVPVPAKILLASPIPIDIPEWVIDLMARWRSSVVIFMPGSAGDDRVARVVRLCTSKDVEHEVKFLVTESFTGAVTRVQAEEHADMVILFSSRPMGHTSRLVLFPVERISRQLSVPVLNFPIVTEGPPEPDSETKRWLWRS